MADNSSNTLDRSAWRAGLAEFIATFSLVLVGAGAIVVQSEVSSLSHLAVALSFGLVIMVMVAAIGHISGAHINPAVTLAFAVFRHFPWRRVPIYAVSQVLGGAAGAGSLYLLFGSNSGLGATVPAIDLAQALAIEILLTASLMFVITAVATDTKAVGQLAAIMIGATVGVNALWAGPLTGASMNPARSLGPALFAGQWLNHWIYWVGPIFGGLLGAGAYSLIREPGTIPEVEQREAKS